MVRDIDIGLIRTFLAVAESGGMTSAAQALNLTQGAVSQQVKRLEALFDKELFDRRQKIMRLTVEGERLMVSAYRLVSLNDEIWQLMTQPAFTGEIRLGVPSDIVRPFMPSILKRFNREHPKIRVTLVSDSTPVLLDALRNKEIDLTLTTEAEQGKDDELLLSDQLIWVGAMNGEACYKTPLPVSLGSGSCAFRAPALEALNKAKIDWQAICQVGNLEPILATLEADMAVAPYMAQIIPDKLIMIDPEVGLPAMPTYHINLRMPSSGNNLIANELADYIRTGFAML